MARKPAKSSKKAGSALDALLKDAQQSPASISSLTTQFSSVMSLAQADIPRLMKQNPGMHVTEARDIDARAKAMSVVIARRFREQRLSAAMREANRPPSGVKGLVDGPTYTEMFNPDWANHCPPDAIEATHSPVAYLTDLYRFAKELEATGDPAQVITLDVRRPDLKDMMLDHTALSRVEPTIVLVNEILEKSIRTHLDGIGLEEKTVDDALLETRYPNALPFERYTSQINYVLGRKDYSLGDVIRATDPAYPYFKEPGVHSQLSDIALIQDSGFGPVQQALLLEAPYFPESDGTENLVKNRSLIAGQWRIDPRTRLLKAVDAEETDSTFFQDNYGVEGFLDLQDTQTFCLRTGLKTEELEALLSVGAFAPGRSPNVTAQDGEEVDGSFSGSIYINAGQSPAMAIETQPGNEEAGQGPSHRITHSSPDRFDRMNRMIRLGRWLELPFDQVDQVVVACMRAEKDNDTYVLTSDTLRALGLFQTLRRKYKVSAEDFAALIHGLGVYGRGKTASHFDRLFNSKALFSSPFKLDGAPLVARPQTESDLQRMEQLCAALSMPYEMFCYVAKLIKQAYGGIPLVWSLDVVSSFYRIIRLPRYLGLTPGEAVALLELINLSSDQLLLKLVGKTRVATYGGGNNADVISGIAALVDCATWCVSRQWGVVDLCTLLVPAFTQPLQTDAQRVLLETMHSRLQSALVTENSFAVVGAPLVTEGIDGVNEAFDWFSALSAFLEDHVSGAKGVVKHWPDADDAQLELQLLLRVQQVLSRWTGDWEEVGIKITNMIMRARAAQISLVIEGLAGYLTVSADMAQELLTWCGGNSHQLLLEVCRVFEAGYMRVDIGDEILLQFLTLSKAGLLARQLNLSALAVQTCMDHPDWLRVPAFKAFTLADVYRLTEYAHGLQRVAHSEEQLLDYFALLHAHWRDDASHNDKRLIRDGAADKVATLMGWNIREVLSAAYHFEPVNGVVFDLVVLDSLVRLHVFSANTALGIESILALGQLHPLASLTDYRRAAELALSSLGKDTPVAPADEVGQSNESFVVVMPDHLVANKPGEQSLVTVCVRDFMGESLENVTVRWSSTLGELADDQSRTDENGEASTYLNSGNERGVAVVKAEYGLGVAVVSPGISIGCDEATLVFSQPVQSKEKGLANGTDAVEFSAVLTDAYENPGADQPVRWLTTLGRFNPPESLADAGGVVRSRLFSDQIGNATVIACHGNGNVQSYKEVAFESIPYFQYVRFVGSLVTDVETEVRCRFVEINGNPKADATVKWDVSPESAGTLTPATSKTDSNGVASTTLVPKVESSIQVFASTGGATKGTGEVIVYPQVRVVRQGASSEVYIIGSAQLVEFFVGLEVGGLAADNVPVAWSIDGGGAVIVRSDAQGISNFKSAFSAGRHQIVASVPGVENRSFEVVGLVHGQFEVVLSDHESGRGGWYEKLNRGLEYLIFTSDAELSVRIFGEGGTPLAGRAYNLEWVHSEVAYQSELDEPSGVSELQPVGHRVRVFALRGPDSSLWPAMRLRLSGPGLADRNLEFCLCHCLSKNSARLEDDGSVALTFINSQGSGSSLAGLATRPLSLKITCTTKGYTGSVVISAIPDHTVPFIVRWDGDATLQIGDVLELVPELFENAVGSLTVAALNTGPWTIE